MVSNPIVVEASYERLYQAVGRTLRDHRFIIARQDAQQGEVITEPLTPYDQGGIDLKKIAPKARVY